MADYDRAGTDRPATYGDLTDSPIFDRTDPPNDSSPTNTGGGGLAQLTPWTEHINAAGFNLSNVGVLGIGVVPPSTTKLLDLSKAIGTLSNGEHIIGVDYVSSITFNTTNGGSFVAWHQTPSITANANMGEIVGLQVQPSYSGTGTISQAHGLETLIAAGANTTLIRGNWIQVGVNFNTTTLAVASDIEGYKDTFGTLTEFRGIRIRTGVTGSGPIGTVVGIDITTLNTGTTKWAFNVGDYNSYHVGKMAFGLNQAPTYAIDILGNAQNRGVIAFTESLATPTDPVASGQMLVYMKADKFIIAYKDNTVMRYKYLDLTSTGVTWVHSATAP